jgi:exodeoxyribonuclease VII small subunit
MSSIAVTARVRAPHPYNESMPEKPPETTPLSFEEGLQQLESIVKEMESGDLPLERALDLFERGMKLSESCRKQLEAAETRVEILTRKAGEMKPEPFPTGSTRNG